MDNAVTKAVRAVGGPTQAGFICRVSAYAIYKWRKQGFIFDARAAVLLARAARAAGLDVTVDELAGLATNGSGPNGEGGLRSGSSRTCDESREVATPSPLIDAPLAHAA